MVYTSPKRTQGPTSPKRSTSPKRTQKNPTFTTNARPVSPEHIHYHRHAHVHTKGTKGMSNLISESIKLAELNNAPSKTTDLLKVAELIQATLMGDKKVDDGNVSLDKPDVGVEKKNVSPVEVEKKNGSVNKPVNVEGNSREQNNLSSIFMGSANTFDHVPNKEQQPVQQEETTQPSPNTNQNQYTSQYNNNKQSFNTNQNQYTSPTTNQYTTNRQSLNPTQTQLPKQPPLPTTTQLQKIIQHLESENASLQSFIEILQSNESILRARLHESKNPSDEKYKIQFQDQEIHTLSQSLAHSQENERRLEIALKESEKKLQDAVGRVAEYTGKVNEMGRKSSRISLELKSIMDQNDLLRKENKRILESERELKGILSNSNSIENVGDDHEFVYDMDMINREISHIQEIKSRYPSDTRLDILINHIQSIIKSPTTTTTIIDLSSMVLGMIEESRGVELKIQAISQESAVVRQETERTVHEMCGNYEGEIKALKGVNEELEKRVEEGKGEVDRCRREISSLRHEYERKKDKDMDKELEKDVTSSKSSLGGNGNAQITSVDSYESQILTLEREIKSLTISQTRLQQLIESHEKTIQSQNLQIATLKNTKLQTRPDDYQSQSHLTQTLSTLENGLEDEKLKNQKAVELINVLHKEVEEGRLEIQELEKLNEKLNDELLDVKGNTGYGGNEYEKLHSLVNTRIQQLKDGEQGDGFGLHEMESLMGVIKGDKDMGLRLRELNELIEGKLKK